MANVELTLHESADRLGVHYMTVYRYVRLGLLRADKVGGTWRVHSDDLNAFRASTTPAAMSARAHDDGSRRRAPWADRLESRLIAGDAQGAWGVVEAALASGAKLADIYLELLVPALQSIGTRWQAGELDVSVERRAVVIAFRLVGRLGPRFTRRGRNRGAVIVGGTSGESEGLGVAITADILRQNGWDVSDLGVGVPPSGFAHMVRTTDAVVAVGLSVLDIDHVSMAAETIVAIRAVAPDVLVVIGGPAVPNQDHAVSLGADHRAADPNEFVELLDLLEPGTMAPRSIASLPRAAVTH